MTAGRVTVARIFSPRPERRDRGLARAIVPGLPIDRYGRTWRIEMSRAHLESLRKNARSVTHLRGRLGFDKTTGAAPSWNDKQNAFVEVRQHDGDVVPFSIRLSDLSIAFQRTSKIKRQSFIGSFQRLLREGDGDEGWTVEDLLTKLSYEDFRARAATIEQVTIVVRPTNPGWSGQELFEPYIEALHGEEARITVKGIDLDLDSEPIEQALVHAVDHDYGELMIKAKNEDGIPIQFDSEDPVPVVDQSANRPTGGEVSYDDLEAAIENATNLDLPSVNADEVDE